MTWKSALPLLLILLILAVLFSLMAGAVSIPPGVVTNTLFDFDGPHQDFIINRSRLPRTILAILTGSALALSGTIVQALLRNGLASPKIIGINSGAALGVLFLSAFLPGLSVGWTPVAAAIGGSVAAAVVFLLSEFRPVTPARLALIGIAFSLLCDAVVDYILVTAPTFSIASPLVWLTGSLWGRGWEEIHLVWLPLCLLSGLSLLLAYRLDLIRLGSEQAQGVGMRVRIERQILLVIATMLAALAVSVVGVLGFVGLMAPHIARRVVGGGHRTVLPASALIGAILVTLSDAAGRAIAPPVEISAGIVTALMGAPFFIYILLTTRSEVQE